MEWRGPHDVVERGDERRTVREVGPELRFGSQGGVRLPDCHRLVHAPSVEVGADGAQKVSDERKDLVVGHGEVEAAVLVLDVAVDGDVWSSVSWRKLPSRPVMASFDST